MTELIDNLTPPELGVLLALISRAQENCGAGKSNDALIGLRARARTLSNMLGHVSWQTWQMEAEKTLPPVRTRKGALSSPYGPEWRYVTVVMRGGTQSRLWEHKDTQEKRWELL